MTGYQQRYEAECSKCDRTIRTKVPETTNTSKGAMIRCGQCGHINHTRTEIPHEQEGDGRFTGVFS